MSEEIQVTIRIPKPPEGWVFSEVRRVYPGEFAFYSGRWATWVLGESLEKHPVAIKAKQYREPVLPADAGKLCEFCDDEKNWCQCYFAELSGYLRGLWITDDAVKYQHCRIEVR